MIWYLRNEVFTMKKTIFSLLASSLLLSSFALAQDEAKVSSDVSYGDMYVIEKREQETRKWGAALGYTYGFSNPYVGVHGTELTLSRKLGQYVGLSLTPTLFMTTDKAVQKDLKEKLSAQDIETSIYRPKHALYASLQLIPISGMLNWFSTNAIDFDLVIGLSGGVIKYDRISQYEPSIKLGITPQFMLSKQLGLYFGVQTAFDRLASSQEWLNRVDTGLGIMSRF